MGRTVRGRSDLVDDPRSSDVFKRVANRAFANEAIASWAGRHTTRRVVEALAGRVPVGPVNTAADIFANPRARKMLVEVEL